AGSCHGDFAPPSLLSNLATLLFAHSSPLGSGTVYALAEAEHPLENAMTLNILCYRVIGVLKHQQLLVLSTKQLERLKSIAQRHHMIPTRTDDQHRALKRRQRLAQFGQCGKQALYRGEGRPGVGVARVADAGAATVAYILAPGGDVRDNMTHLSDE